MVLQLTIVALVVKFTPRATGGLRLLGAVRVLDALFRLLLTLDPIIAFYNTLLHLRAVVQVLLSFVCL